MIPVLTPDDRAFAELTTDLTTRHRDQVTAAEVARAVAAARAEVEPGTRHPDFTLVLVERRARELLEDAVAARGERLRVVPTILFVCEHNLARSQMAAAFAQHHAGERVRVRSAGPRPAGRLNPLVEPAMAEKGIILKDPYPAGITDDVLHAADVIVEIGCELPDVPARRHIRWEVVDPHGQAMDVVRRARDAVEALVVDLLADLDLLVRP